MRRLVLPLCLAASLGGCVVNVPPPGANAGTSRLPTNMVVSPDGSTFTLHGTLIALPGVPLQIGFFNDPLAPDCSLAAIAPALISVTTPPAHGSVKILHTQGYTHFASNTQLYPCNTKSVPGQTVTYASRPDYSGEDDFTLKIYLSDGHEIIQNETMKVGE